MSFPAVGSKSGLERRSLDLAISKSSKAKEYSETARLRESNLDGYSSCCQGRLLNPIQPASRRQRSISARGADRGSTASALPGLSPDKLGWCGPAPAASEAAMC